ncbi:DUF4391 domain-containing protein [Gammaproteobacteria bacterium]|nr:DUF4391 domain-containing protein [Gammaproteobacteria bacterium]
MGLYQFPKKAAFGRALAKSKIYERAGVNTKLKARFVNDISTIVWAYKLAPQTINIPASQGVQELQVFTLDLKVPDLSVEVLEVIDKAIPSPILFELNYRGKQSYTAAYKRISEADKTKWVISSYFETQWFSVSDKREALPMVLNMTALYHALLRSIISVPARDGESIEQLVDRVEKLQQKEREAAQLSSRIRKEKQFNRRVELNRMLSMLRKDISQLTS